MNATKRSVARAGLVGFSILVVALTGCRTQVVHEHTRTVYVPAPPPVVNVPPAPAPQPPPTVVYAPPEPAPQPPPQVVVVPQPEQPPVVVIQSENDFYEPLAAHGRWVVVGSYGRCWIPARVDAGWRPYSNGYWQRTDAGWYWASDEPWGWATYHYGRWDFHAQYGWVWVPQTQWAPAWVSWREGGGYVGWAPLRPSVTVGVNIHVGDYEPAFASRAFVFVEHKRMLEPVRPKTVVVHNTTIINKTVNITNVRVVNKTVINEGPRPDVIERESGRKVQTVAVREFRHREEAKVAARERNIPTARDRKVEPPARTERQPAETKAVVPPAARQAEKPADAMARPLRSTATPARSTPPRTETERPTREEMLEKRNTPASPTVKPEVKPEVKSEQLAPARREVRPVEKPVVAARPTPQPITRLPVPDDKRRETAIEKRSTATPPAVEPRPRQEIRPETRRETNPPVKVEAVAPSAVRSQAAPPSEKPADKRLIAPREQSRAADRAETNKIKKVEDQETRATVVPRRPSR